jgi:hypothetical protein
MKPIVAGGCIVAGLMLEAVALANFSPATFVGFVMVGTPLTIAGALYFAVRAVAVRWSSR